MKKCLSPGRILEGTGATSRLQLLIAGVCDHEVVVYCGHLGCDTV
jgi:hypothetical protein